MPRSTPPAAVELIKRFEGYRAAPYLCPADVWTIGWGATRGLDGLPVTRTTPALTPEEGERLLARDLGRFAAEVERLVPVPLTDGQFGALVSFAFNLGGSRLASSTLRRRIVAGDHEAAADEFRKWVMAGGRRLPGLVARREAERALFLTVPEPPPPPPPEPRDTLIGRFMAAFADASR